MYKLLRNINVVTTLLTGYVAAVLLCAAPVLWLAVAAGLLWRAAKRERKSGAYGTARWADASDVPQMLQGHGLIVGHMAGRLTKLDGLKALFDPRLDPRRSCERFLLSFKRDQPKHLVRLTNAVHTAVFAPTGVGKGVSCVVPFLLTCPDSMVVVDLKGENCLLTAVERRRRMGHRIVLLDPYKVVTGKLTDTFNPLDFIDKDSRTAVDDCRDLAEALVVRTGQEREPHWADSAEVWIAAMTAMVVTFARGEDKSLQSVRTLLTDPQKMQAAIKLMCESGEMDGMLSRLGHQLTQFKEKELSSTLTTTNRYLRFLDTVTISDNTRRSTFDPADLLRQRVTVYLVLPPDRMRAQSPLLRMWIGSLLRAVVKGGLQGDRRVHFVLDEAASLGHMEALDDAVDKFRGYGVRLLFLYQSLGQLQKCFPEGQDQTLLGNVTQVFFGVNDQQTAEYVSGRLGESTIVVDSGGTGRGTSTSHQSSGQGGNSYSDSRNSNQNWQYSGRRLLKPEEVATLSPRVALTFSPGKPPIATRLVRYYEPGFGDAPRLSLAKAVFETACMFLCAAGLAVMFTAWLFNYRFR